MAVTLLCPKLTCRAVLRVPDNVRGKRVRCAECGTTFLVPDAKKPAAAAQRSSAEQHAKPQAKA